MKKASGIGNAIVSARSWSWNQKNVFFSSCFSLTSFSSFCSIAQGNRVTISVPFWAKEEAYHWVCRFDLSLQHKKRTGVLVLCVEVHCPVGHLHVQSGYRFLHILRQSLRLLLDWYKVLQLVIRLRGQFEQHCNFLSNFRVRLIPISGSKDLILSLHSQLLFNRSETKRLLANPS